MSKVETMNRRIRQLDQQLARVNAPSRERVDLLNALAWELWTTDADRATQLTLEAEQMAGSLEYDRGRHHAMVNRALMEWQEDTDKAIPVLLEALQWFETHQDKKGEANALGILAIIYWAFGDYQRGFEYGTRALNLYREVGDQDGVGWAYNTMGGFYYDWKDYQNTLKFFRQGYQTFRKTGNAIGEARALNGIGNAYHYLGDYQKALKYQKKSLDIQQQINHRMTESRTLNDLGLIYRSLGDYDKALEYHFQSLQIRRELNYLTGQTTTLMDLGDLYLEKQDYQQAQEYYREGLALSEQIHARPKIVRALGGLSKVFEAIGDYARALEYYKKFHRTEEEVFHEDAETKLKNIKSVYELESSRKEAEIFRLRNVELRSKNEELQETIRKLNAAQAQLIQAGKMAALGNLVAGIVHEINTPIGTILSGNDVVRRVVEKIQSGLQSLRNGDGWQSEVERSVPILLENQQNNQAAIERIIDILQSLKSFSRLDEAEFKKVDIHKGLESALTLISHEIKDRIEVRRDYGELPPVYVYVNEINQVFMNLLLNAVQAIPGRGRVIVQTYPGEGCVCIRISDTGKGIPPEKLEQLFEPGFSENQQRIKMRTGLYASYNIINRHQGSLQVESRVGEGTSFIITIPTNLDELISTA